MFEDNIEENLREEEIRKSARDEYAKESEYEKMLDYIWILFQNLEDSRDPDLVEAAVYFVQNHDFDLDELPESIRKRVKWALREEESESFFGAEAALLDQLDNAYKYLGYD